MMWVGDLQGNEPGILGQEPSTITTQLLTWLNVFGFSYLGLKGFVLNLHPH
jgi:hypothetical protein